MGAAIDITQDAVGKSEDVPIFTEVVPCYQGFSQSEATLQTKEFVSILRRYIIGLR
jgi:hypothetical protein